MTTTQSDLKTTHFGTGFQVETTDGRVVQVIDTGRTVTFRGAWLSDLNNGRELVFTGSLSASEKDGVVSGLLTRLERA